MTKSRKKRKRQWELFYGSPPYDAGADHPAFVLVEKDAALQAVCALRATTWAEFVDAAGITFTELMESWGDEIEGYYGVRPGIHDRFSLIECWGATYFSDLIIDPRQAATDLVSESRELADAFFGAGFEVFIGAPGAGVDETLFRDRSCIERLPPEIAAHIHEDEALVRACLLGEADWH